MQSAHHRQEEEDKEKQARPAVGQQGPSQHSYSYTSGVNLKFSLIVEAEINPSLVYNWCQSHRKRELKVVSRCSPEPFQYLHLSSSNTTVVDHKFIVVEKLSCAFNSQLMCLLFNVNSQHC